jgi:hypothetical protein
MSRKATEEALGTDPRDVDLRIDLKKLLQSSPPESFSKQALANPAAAKETLASALLSEERETVSEKAKSAG